MKEEEITEIDSSMPNAAKPGNKGRVKKIILVISAILAAAALVLAVLNYLGFFAEPASVAIIAGDKFPGAGSAKEIMEAMQAEVDLSEFSFEINAEPVFAGGSSEGDLYITNPAGNGYPMVVQIVQDDTGEIIYDSGGIMPGYQIVNDKLTKVLEKGEHNATAHFYAFDPETEEAVGEVTASIVITIQN